MTARATAGTRRSLQTFTGSLFFNGGNDGTSIANTGISGAGAWSSSIWLRPNRTAGAFAVATHFGTAGGGGGQAWLACAQNSATPGALITRLGGVGSVTGLVPTKYWQQWTATYDGVTCSVYRNGALVAASALTGAVVNNPFRLAWDGTGSRFTGFIGPVRLWSRLLTTAEVLADYNGNVPTTNLIGRWEMTDGSGTTVTDSSGSGNHITIDGDVVWSADTPTKARTVATARATATARTAV